MSIPPIVQERESVPRSSTNGATVRMRRLPRLSSVSAQPRRRSARALRRVHWQLHDDEESRLIILEQKLSLVQVGDGLSQRQAKAGALVGAARIEPPEALHRLLPALQRDSGAPVGDFDPDLLLARAYPDLDLSAARSIADRVLDEVADRL